ncbi:MAG TPA: hypothetical protein PLQ00_04320, partial [Thermoguttaceae bacterium]|nr:hypothetical protein [Thermoguttaceae bacterium]
VKSPAKTSQLPAHLRPRPREPPAKTFLHLQPAQTFAAMILPPEKEAYEKTLPLWPRLLPGAAGYGPPLGKAVSCPIPPASRHRLGANTGCLGPSDRKRQDRRTE